MIDAASVIVLFAVYFGFAFLAGREYGSDGESRAVQRAREAAEIAELQAREAAAIRAREAALLGQDGRRS